MLCMTNLQDRIDNMSDEDKNEALLDLTELAFNLATTLRTLEVYTETAVEVAQLTGDDIDFSAVAGMILTMRSEGQLTENAQLALDHPKVNNYIAMVVADVAQEQFGVDLTKFDAPRDFADDFADIDLSEVEGLQEIIDAIEAALDNGDVTLDALSRYL